MDTFHIHEMTEAQLKNAGYDLFIRREQLRAETMQVEQALQLVITEIEKRSVTDGTRAEENPG
jgi:hypothetical protein